MSIGATTSATQVMADRADRLPTQTLNQDDFLKLLIAQLTSQDPLKPMQDTEFMGQMAQFSTLQATQQMSSNIAQLSTAQAVAQASTLIGRSVELTDAQANLVRGVVSAVELTSGTPQIVVNGTPYTLGQLRTVTAALNEQETT